jgi:L-fucose mutarotase
MLKGLDPRLNADVLHALMSMGHGDTIVIADTNFPASSVARSTHLGRPLMMSNLSAAQTVQAICLSTHSSTTLRCGWKW